MPSIPRSGSTLLGAILNQNPSLFVTPTSPLLDLLNNTEQSFAQITQARAWSDPEQKLNVCRGIFESIYRHIPRPVVIDKHRAWIKNVEALQMILGYPPKFIYPVRDLAEVVASFLTLVKRAREKGQANFVDRMLAERGLAIDDYNSSQAIVESVREHFDDLHMALKRWPNLIHLVEYRDLVQQPDRVVDGIYDFLGMAPFFHEFDRIQPMIEEDDRFWGLEGLHAIRPQLQRTSKDPVDVIGERAYDSIRSLNAEFWR